MNNRRQEILHTTSQLMETQGYHATGVNQILEASGAPKGSLYYYFPEGKDGLTEQVIQRTAERIESRIRLVMTEYDDPATAVAAFFVTLSGYVEAANYASGGPITTIALEVASTNERLNAACHAAYGRWQQAFADKLLAHGYSEESAHSLATLIISAIEGATILARSQKSIRPLHEAGEQLALLLEATRP
jgi:TetR/AcrR family transcriptional repressor of lmrAB and yxaGH operons